MEHLRTLNAVAGRLSLREPQARSLTSLARALEAAPAMLARERSLDAVLATLKAEFPTLQDFERDFPSLCFALATGVGKTRLMGAFIRYLHLSYGITHFFVLAPNLTIYEKLKADFTPNTPKYVFNLKTAAILVPRASAAGLAGRSDRRCAGRCRPAGLPIDRFWATAPQQP